MFGPWACLGLPAFNQRRLGVPKIRHSFPQQTISTVSIDIRCRESWRSVDIAGDVG